MQKMSKSKFKTHFLLLFVITLNLFFDGITGLQSV